MKAKKIFAMMTAVALLALLWVVSGFETARLRTPAEAAPPGWGHNVLPLRAGSKGVGAFPPERPRAQGGAPTVVSYQGRITVNGSPYSGNGYFKFAIVDSPCTTFYWSNDGEGRCDTQPTDAVQLSVSEGLFNVLLGDTTLSGMTQALDASVFSGTDRYLRVWFSTSAGGPFTQLGDQRISSVPFALQAQEAANADKLDGSDSTAFAAATHDHDTAYWKLTGNSGTTPGTNFLGTTDNVTLTLRVSNTIALRLAPAGSTPNIIGGYSGNWVTSGVKGATIGGGGESGHTNRVTDNYGTVGGGANNLAGSDDAITTNDHYATVGGGRGNTAIGSGATVGGGFSNTAGESCTVGGGGGNEASGMGTTVGGGSSNKASNVFATVGGGYYNEATNYATTVPGGIYAKASLLGQMAYASGRFANTGDAQFSLYVMRRSISNHTTWENLYLDGVDDLLTIPSGRTLAFDILVVGRSDGGESAGYRIYGVIENVGGTTSFIGYTVTTIGEDVITWDAQAKDDDTNDALLVQVKGAGENIRWVAVVRTAEVAW